MVKVRVFVVKDRFDNIVNVTADKQEAIEEALESDSLDSFEDFVDKWMANNAGCDLLDLLDEREPKVVLRDMYVQEIEEELEAGDLECIEIYDVNIPFEAIEPNKQIPPEILAVIVNIFNC